MPRIGIAHFQSRTAARPDGFRPQMGTGSPALPDGGATAPHPLADLLRSLRGREIAALVSGTEMEGRLIAFPPVALVSPGGRVTVVPLDRIASIRY